MEPESRYRFRGVKQDFRALELGCFAAADTIEREGLDGSARVRTYWPRAIELERLVVTLY